tara:strand:+ start:263 stop:1108 length:846 start_codon:yes stop_codon:yes gene_type:complete
MNSKKNKGLGKGLSALFGDQKKAENTNEIAGNLQKALIGDLERNQYQPRSIFEEDKLIELANSIKKNGIIQPIAVRKSKSGKSKFEIVAGERRWIAAQKAGLHEVPINILEVNDSETLEIAIVENIQREDLNIIEEARGYKRLFDEFNYDQEKIAKMMSKSRSHISNTLRLLSLPADIISMIEDGELTAGQARPLIGLPNASQIAEEIIAKKLSARSIENLKKRKTKSFIIDPNVFDEQRDIERKLGLKVLITNKKNNSGKISVEYKNLDQFDLITKKLKS